MKKMDFGEAITSLKDGLCVARDGWNGKGMFIWLNKGSQMMQEIKARETHIEGVAVGLFESGAVGTVTRLPNINMRSANGSTVTGWLASQTDMLAEDWQIVKWGDDETNPNYK